MSCEECTYLGKRCEYCQQIHIEEVRRRALGDKRLDRAIKTARTTWKCKLCSCCTNIDIALVYRDCPDNMYVGHKTPAHAGGEHCVKNLKYFVKQSLTKKRT